MSQENIATVVKILESLPDSQQERVIEYLKEYMTDLEDELRWNNSFENTQSQLVAAAKRAKQQIAQGLAQPMDDKEL